MIETNFDGIVGPTHNYAGLAYGNRASLAHAYQVSHPKAAAIQGLDKMHLLMQLGLSQAVLPPHERPNLPLLRSLGFTGSDAAILTKARKEAPALFYACYSSSSMWTANAATVSPSRDCLDGKLHITAANLISHFHRFMESEMTVRILSRIFKDNSKFIVHPPLLSHLSFADEGAANHNRLCLKYGEPGLEIFVYGRSGFAGSKPVATPRAQPLDSDEPRLYPGRQTLEASKAIARNHQLDEHRTFFVKQNPRAIDKGVFHNDVISVINENVILSHELAFDGGDAFFQSIQEKISFPIYFLQVKELELSIEDAVSTYLFNSQLVTLPNDKGMVLIAPLESRDNPRAFKVIQKIIEGDNPIGSVHYVDCRESMKNGGGPACLRLRVVLTEAEKKALLPEIFLNEAKYTTLKQWVERHYREKISGDDLLDPLLVKESQQALDELTKILNLGSIYSFQK